MSPTPLRIPTEHDAATIVQTVFQRNVQHVSRFPTGLCHYVYKVVTNGQPLVVRIASADTRSLLAGGVYWSNVLRPHGVPLPALLYSDLDAAIVPFAFMVLEHLPGTDLGHAYAHLTRHEKHSIAAAIVDAQSQVHTLPPGNGFGYAMSLDDELPHRTWTGVIEASLDRSHQRIAQIGVVDARHVERVRQRLTHFQAYLAHVAPTPFLDDTTTKNVLVHNGQLSGIVDVDLICYGDPLWTVALTHMALLSQQADLDYIAAWSAHLSLTAEQHRVLHFYTAVFCIDFLSELGQVFNKDRAEPVDESRIHHLTHILDDLLNAS